MIVTAVRNALEKTPPELVTDVSNNGMLLAGGGAMLRGLDQLISQQSEISVIVDEDPLTTVLRGTGIALEQEKSMEYVFVN
jgi:rod shape-determining protein MreB